MTACPKPTNSEQTIERILLAAEEVLSTEGVAKLTLRRIALAAHLSLGTLTYYFPSREALIDSLLEQQNRDWTDEFKASAARLGDGITPAKLVEEVVRRQFRASVAGRARARLRAVTVLSGGALEMHGQNRLVYSLNHQVARVFVELFGMNEVDARLRIYSITLAVGRYATMMPTEFCILVGVDDVEDATQRVEDHLVDLAQQLLLPAALPPSGSASQPSRKALSSDS